MRRPRYSQSRSLSIEMIVLISPHFEQEIAKIPEVECANPAIHNPVVFSMERLFRSHLILNRRSRRSQRGVECADRAIHNSVVFSMETIVPISPQFEQEIAKISEEVECADPAIHNPGAVSIEKIVPISPQLVAAPSGNCR
jgi:hypothetical protein